MSTTCMLSSLRGKSVSVRLSTTLPCLYAPMFISFFDCTATMWCLMMIIIIIIYLLDCCSKCCGLMTQSNGSLLSWKFACIIPARLDSVHKSSPSPSQARCTIYWGSTTTRCVRAAWVGALTSASTPSSTNRSAPPWRPMTQTVTRPDMSLQTTIKVRWLMSHCAPCLENSRVAENITLPPNFYLNFLLNKFLINSGRYTKMKMKI